MKAIHPGSTWGDQHIGDCFNSCPSKNQIIMQFCCCCTSPSYLSFFFFLLLSLLPLLETGWLMAAGNLSAVREEGENTARSEKGEHTGVPNGSPCASLLTGNPGRLSYLGHLYMYCCTLAQLCCNIRENCTQPLCTLCFWLTCEHTYTHIHPLIALPGNGLILLRHSNGKSAGN